MQEATKSHLLTVRCFSQTLREMLLERGHQLSRWDLDIELAQGASVALVTARSLRGATELLNLIREGSAVLVPDTLYE